MDLGTRRLVLPLLILAQACGGSSSDVTPKDETTPARSAASPSEAVPGGCDHEKLDALVQVLEAAPPIRRADLVADHLVDACEAPTFFADYLDMTNDEPDQRRAMMRGRPEDQRAALLRACPKVDEVFRAAAQAAAADRNAIVFDGCDFERFGLVDRDEYARGPSMRVPWLMHQWLLDQGVEAAVAEPITHALFIHGRRAAARLPLPPALDLAVVPHPLEPIPDGMIIYVARDGIELSSGRLLAIERGAIDPATVTDHHIGPLFETLMQDVDLGKVMAERRGEDWHPLAIVAADAGLPYSVILDIHYTIGRAGIPNWTLVATSESGTYGTVPVRSPRVAMGPLPRPVAVPLQVVIDSGGFLVRGPDETEPRRIGIRTATGHDAWDYEALGRHATEHRDRYPGITEAVVTPEGDTPHGVVVRSLAALRGPQCPERRECLLPDLILGGVF